MPMYRIVWEIDIDAETPEKAARKALKYQRNPDSHATVFDVHDGEGNVSQADLLGDEMAIVRNKEQT